MEGGNPEASIQLLKQKYDLHKAPEVDSAARRSEARTGERVPQNPLDRIQNYLNRFHEITDRENPQQRERAMEAVKRLLHSKYIIKPDEITEGYWENQRRIIRERGQEADLQHVNWEELKRQNIEAIVADQKSSMDKWIDYLSSSDALYPDALKYWTLRSVLSMGEYDKEKKAYPQRSIGTTKPFPDLNREALAYVIDIVDKKYTAKGAKRANEDTDPELEKLLQGENFAKLYAFAIEKVIPADKQGLVDTTGRWVKYDQGSDHMPLVTSLQGHGTGWCTAGESTAQAQLKGGDFYVYYSNDRDAKPTVPRVAIRMEGGSIAEVRGIAPEQNLDPYMAPIVEQKLDEFPDGKAYQKKVADMKHLTEIDHKMQKGMLLEASELVFLYEVDSLIQGFGYSRDPRIEELRNQRNPEEDMSIMFGCEPSQIAHNLGELRHDTKAYVGPLLPGIFDRLQSHNIEHVYTSFPEGKIRRQQVEIGGKTKEQLQNELKQAGVNITSIAQGMMENPKFTTLPDAQVLDTVKVKVGDLGLSGKPTAAEIYRKAQALGLELCPAEVGPHMRLQTKDQPLGDYYWIGMRQITDSYGTQGVFGLERRIGGLWLCDGWAEPDPKWEPDHGFVFSLRKFKTQKPQTLSSLLKNLIKR
ncbi:hypothetical protein HGB07_03040 [Candidatus Roizmanbacteria bacterium]|nr:hypothetical protein [Candidatus Roizmanbacteria bacterium]